MSSFHEILFPTDISFHSKGGPKFKTGVFTADSGFEKRIIDWAQARAEYDASYGIKDQSQMDKVTAFFYARRGRAHAFRFKDWNDYKLNGVAFLGTGSPTVQITKTYTSAQAQISQSWTFTRKITKPAWNSISGVTVNGSVVTSPGAYTVDYNTGIMTFTTPPAEGDVIVIGSGEFHVPVRFDSDHLAVKHEFWNTVSWDSIPLIEDRTDWDLIIGNVLPVVGTPVGLWSADFVNGLYFVNSAVSDLTTMFATADASTGYPAFDPATGVIPGLGLTEAAVGCTTTTFTPIAGGGTYVIDFYLTYRWSTIEFDFSDTSGGDHALATIICSDDYLTTDLSSYDVGGTTTTSPSIGPGNHKIAVTLTLGNMDISIDGGTVNTITGTSTGTANSLAFHVKPYGYHENERSAYIKSITAYAPKLTFELPALAQNTVVPPANPLTPPTVPAQIFDANFGVGTYSLNGGSALLTDLFTENLNWGPFDPSSAVTAGHLYNCSPVLKPAVVADLMAYGGGTFIFTGLIGNFTASAYFGSFELSDADFLQQSILWLLQTETFIQETIFNFVDITPIVTNGPSEVPVKIAFTVMWDRVSCSINGGPVFTIPRRLHAAKETFFGLDCNRLVLSRAQLYTAYADSALPGLSA